MERGREGEIYIYIERGGGGRKREGESRVQMKEVKEG